MPVLKTALPNINVLYNERDDSNHTLFSGTKILQARYFCDKNVHGVVLRTGYLTAKGSLVRSILYPPPADFRFDKDTYRFIWILATVAVSGSIYTAVAKVNNNHDCTYVHYSVLKLGLCKFTRALLKHLKIPAGV